MTWSNKHKATFQTKNALKKKKDVAFGDANTMWLRRTDMFRIFVDDICGRIKPLFEDIHPSPATIDLFAN